MTIKFPCSVCYKSVAKNHKAVKCSCCKKWIHIKCNHIDVNTYELLKISNDNWHCITCTKTIIPFSSLNDEHLQLTLQGKNFNITANSDLNIDNNKQFYNDNNHLTLFMPGGGGGRIPPRSYNFYCQFLKNDHVMLIFRHF